jgi:hypothetical protein
VIQHCLQCDRPMHLRGGDRAVFCAECAEPKYRLVPVHPLPRSEAHDLDARALRARLEDRERVIAAFRERCQKLEAVAEAARAFWLLKQVSTREGIALGNALSALDAKEST